MQGVEMQREVRIADVGVVVNGHQREVAHVRAHDGIELIEIVVKELQEPRRADRLTGRNDGTLDWPIGDREKQYAGNLYKTIGGIRLNIDEDVVAGPMAR